MTQSAKQTILRLPLWILLLRLVPLAGGLALALTVRHWAALVGAVLLGMTSLAAAAAWLRFRVAFDREGLRVRSMTVANRRCAYRDLWGIEGKKRLYLDKGSVRLRRGAAWDDLVQTAQRGYQRAHGGKRIPRVYSVRRSRDPYNGNVWQPGEFIFVFVILYLLYLGFFLFILFGIDTDVGPLVFFPIGLLVLHPAFVIFHIYVGRNADILPRWIVELCFRPSALTFRRD
ncbi:MAG: hypothetical protein IKP19_00630 [Oscillospiraceae bacterium]|nr:hypothetical protein [Oscillospiraceae bacterium]